MRTAGPRRSYPRPSPSTGTRRTRSTAAPHPHPVRDSPVRPGRAPRPRHAGTPRRGARRHTPRAGSLQRHVGRERPARGSRLLRGVSLQPAGVRGTRNGADDAREVRGRRSRDVGSRCRYRFGRMRGVTADNFSPKWYSFHIPTAFQER